MIFTPLKITTKYEKRKKNSSASAAGADQLLAEMQGRCASFAGTYLNLEHEKPFIKIESRGHIFARQKLRSRDEH
jgi:hypothetical protein